MNTIRALLGQVVDYAGLFPPAKLDMAPTLEHYARHQASPYAWMLGRLIIPAARFEEFTDCLAAHGANRPDASLPWPISTLGAPADDVDAWLDGLRRDLAVMALLSASHDGRLVLDAYERALPRRLVEEMNAGEQAAFLEQTRAALGGGGASLISVALEVPFVDNWREAIPAWVAVLSESNRALQDENQAIFAVKIRTGGVDAHQFPSPTQVAGALAACAARGVPLKATAGLHHPFRHHNASVDCLMHGFLNVFGAAALLHVAEIDAAGAEAMLGDTDPAQFTLDDSGMGWQDHRVSTAEIAAARADAALSFGSCSFDEPIADLVAAGLLDA